MWRLYGPHDPEVFSAHVSRRHHRSQWTARRQPRCRARCSRTRRVARGAPAPSPHLENIPIDWLEAELRTTEALTRAFDGADAVFHCAAAVGVKREVTPEMTPRTCTGTPNVIDAASPPRCRGSCTRRRWSRSACRPTAARATRPRRGTSTPRAWSTPTRSPSTRPRKSCTPRRDRARRRDRQPDVHVRSARRAAELGQADRRGRARGVPGWTPGYNNFVDVRDVARGMIAAWQRGRRGERYILGGHDLTYRDGVRAGSRGSPACGRRGSACRTPRRGLLGACRRLRRGARPRAARQLDADPLRVHRSFRFTSEQGGARARLHVRPARARDPRCESSRGSR